MEETSSYIFTSIDNPTVNNNNPAMLPAGLQGPAAGAQQIDLGSEGHGEHYSDEAGWSSEEFEDDSSNNTNPQEQIINLLQVSTAI